uniref:DUF5641 domain-containing protein n=1 Tax=Trichogramma kaykai TaxID=54128 RepID=A0ABD2WGE9_9HYME
MATKAVHLEAVSAYDTSAFLAAFRRFVSRRGPCRHLYSDRGTNFVGADAELRRMHSEGSGYYKSICAQLHDGHSTVWHFNPPSSPHFGGLWESGVKSVKYHLKRMVGDRSFTFEEFSTLLAQIEAILNSRPLTPLPDSFEPQNVLTPAHPLIGESSVVIAEPPLTEAKLSPSERWLQIQQITQEFWQRWCEEYLSTLQKRNKWLSSAKNFAVDDVVLVRDEILPCARWPLARVSAVHLGSDGLVRSVTVTTAKGSSKRPIVKLVQLVDHD